jgi:hypothetical protein
VVLWHRARQRRAPIERAAYEQLFGKVAKIFEIHGVMNFPLFFYVKSAKKQSVSFLSFTLQLLHGFSMHPELEGLPKFDIHDIYEKWGQGTRLVI